MKKVFLCSWAISFDYCFVGCCSQVANPSLCILLRKQDCLLRQADRQRFFEEAGNLNKTFPFLEAASHVPG